MSADPVVTTSADGVVTITAEYELPLDEDEQEEPAALSDPLGDIIVGAGRAVGKLLGAAWRAVRPDSDAQPEMEEE